MVDCMHGKIIWWCLQKETSFDKCKSGELHEVQHEVRNSEFENHLSICLKTKYVPKRSSPKQCLKIHVLPVTKHSASPL
jgi:hypothetical protein